MKDATKNATNTGCQYELDVLMENLNKGFSIEFSKTVHGKEVDIIDISNNRLIEIKSYSTSGWLTLGKNLGHQAGAQFSIINPEFLSQFSERMGRVRIEPTADPTWYNATKEELIGEIKKIIIHPNAGDNYINKLNNMTHLTIENATGIHTIERALWNN